LRSFASVRGGVVGQVLDDPTRFLLGQPVHGDSLTENILDDAFELLLGQRLPLGQVVDVVDLFLARGFFVLAVGGCLAVAVGPVAVST